MKLLPPTLVLLILIAMLSLYVLEFGPTVVPHPYSLVGLIPLVGGLALAVIGSRHFAQVDTNIKTFDDPTRLVTDGLFRYSRNPMYLGFVLFLFGTALLVGTLPAFGLAALFAVVTDLWYIRFEEKAMRRCFGAAYDAYAGSVRRWI